ncbi:MAG: flagellar type III secretion system pore protein FliP [candidate division WS1 bacterium]|jgi:flagellar biosynthetic protein FliP|nr:flagellar type III secretion system pore protein FliP [candidate division WS1 bacterium]
MRRFLRCWGLTIALAAAAGVAHAQPPAMPALPEALAAEEPEQVVMTLRILLGLAVLSLAPALLMTLTSFTRIVIVLSFLRSALGTQQTPPNAVLVGLALFLTLFVMHPVIDRISSEGVAPYLEGEIGYDVAIERSAGPLREFMLAQTRERDLALFYEISGAPRPASPGEVPFHILMPGFVISELKSAFQIGFVLFIPFLVIDLVVAGALMSMGMLMVPPVMISLPVKILLFVMVDGWHLVTRSVVLSFT